MNYSFKIILGSGSPRRKDLLESIMLKPEVIRPQVEEKKLPHETALEYVSRNSKLKANWIASHLLEKKSQEKSVIISADTIVVVDNKVLEKPSDKEDACSMLRLLSGRSHLVHTCFTLLPILISHEPVTHVVTTEVFFRELPESEIEQYTSTPEPFDKAGSYGAQGFGASFVDHIVGSYTNVVGLPLAQLTEKLRQIEQSV